MESSKKPDVSVVMPVYNSGACLRETLDLLRNQTLGNIEILCVDDGSDDNSSGILEEYSEADRRIRAIRRNHEGAGAARNAGLGEARGEYVIFLDSDDIFDPTLLEKTWKKGKSTQSDVVLFGAKRYDDRTKKTVDAPRYLWRKLIPEKEVFSRKDMNGRLFGLTVTTPWTKLFRRKFIQEQQISFQNLPNSNVVFFVLVALAAAERISIVREDLLSYRVHREGSLQNCKDREPLCFLKAYEDTYEELNRRGLYGEVRQGFADLVLSGCVFNLNTVRSESARWTIIHALCSEQFLRMGILDMTGEEDHAPDGNAPSREGMYRNVPAGYDMPEYYARIKGLPHAVRMREELEKGKDGEPETLVRRGVADIPPKVSVIIPVYNTKKYLAQCLESILGQTLKEIEIICMDDGSEDGSSDLLLSYAEADSRITVYRQKNRGLSEARSRSLRHASGEYVYFLDSDDMLRRDGLEGLYERSRMSELDVLYFDGRDFYDSDKLKEQYPQFCGYYIRTGEYPASCAGAEMFRQMRSTGEYRTNVGIAFFRRQYLLEQGLWFTPGILHEDNDFSFRAMLLAERAGYTGEAWFIRRIREDSIMTARAGFPESYGYFKSFLNMLAFLGKYSYPEEMTEILFGTLQGVLDLAKDIYNALPAEERWAAEGLPGAERIYYRFFVEKDAAMREKLARAYAAKSGINATLQRTYQEKSEINRKLQITYGEKYDRGLEIKRLKKELDAVKSSETYRLARLIGLPVRIFRRIFRKGIWRKYQ